jgi:hypothetical protein
LVEGELGRFAMIRGEEPTQTYNRLKTLVNKIRSYGSTRWTDHNVVRLMLRSFTVINPHLVNLIRENPRYTNMTPEEILGKFVSGRMMVKEARYIDDALNGPLPVYEPQPVALKATSSREALPSKVAQVEVAGLNEDEMALIIKRFKTALKGRKEYPNKNKAKGKHCDILAPGMGCPGPRLNRINSVIIPTRCIFFFGSLSRKNLQVKRAWLGAIWDG